MPKWSGGAMPYGYNYLGDMQIVVDKFERNVLLTIFQMVESKTSIRDISFKLNDYKFKTKRNTAWKDPTIRQILSPKRLRFYAGDGEITHEAIITKERAEKLIHLLKKDKTSRKKSNIFLLSNLHILHCGTCGGLEKAVTARREGKEDHYYGCANRQILGPKKCKNSKLQRQDIINELVLTDLLVHHSNIEKIKNYTNKAERSKEKELNIQIEKLSSDINKLMYKQLKTKDPSGIHRVDIKLKELFAKRTILTEQKFNTFDFDSFKKDAKNIKSVDIKQQRILIKRFVEKVTVFSDHILVKYPFAINSHGEYTKRLEI